MKSEIHLDGILTTVASHPARGAWIEMAKRCMLPC